MSTPDPLTRLVRACNPAEHLGSKDLRYVDFDEARGGGNNLQRLVRAFARSDVPIARLFAGHRGIGKTSDLMRLKAKLESEAKFDVLFLDAGVKLDDNDLEFPDLLVLIAGELMDHLEETYDESYVQTAASYLINRWRDLWDLLLSEVKIKDAKAEIPKFGALTLELKNRPSARKFMREQIEKLATNLLEGINQLLTETNARLKQEGKTGLVLIIDGLDKIALRELEGGTNTHERLFVNRAEHLAALETHVVYTVPISLIHSSGFSATVLQKFGGEKVLTPMVRVRGEDKSEVSENTLGMQKLWEMIQLRCKHAKIEIDEAFESNETWIKLCEASGGHPRHLMTLLTSAANQQDELPITMDSVERAIREYANSLQLEIPQEFWPKLIRFNEPQSIMPHDEQHLEMLFHLYIFQYFNGEPWYEVNPVIRTLNRFQQALGEQPSPIELS